MQLINRTLDILVILSKQADGLSVLELAKKIGIPNSSTHRILQSLKNNGFVIQSTDTKKYRLGYKVLTLSSNIIKENQLVVTAKPYMHELAKELHETVTLNVLDNDSVICLYSIDSPDTPLFMVRPGYTISPHATAAGKVIQAYMKEESIKRIYKRNGLEKFTANTKTKLKDYLEELAAIKDQGYAVSDEELQLGVQGVACPIFDYNKKIAGAISFTALKANGSFNELNLEKLHKCALKITSSISGIKLQ